MSKIYTVQFEVEEGSDEFWDSMPSNEEVRDFILTEIEGTGIHLHSNVKIVRIVDTYVYDGK